MLQRCAAVVSLETAPLVTRETAGVLSEPLEMVVYVTSWLSAMSITWPKSPACSRSLLVMTPERLSDDTSLRCTSSGKGHRQT
jgi:hypothetical protein